MNPPRILAAVAAASASILAQNTATYSVYGTGCNHGPVSSCIAQNDQNPSLRLATLPNEYAYPVVNNSGLPMQIVGFDVYTQTNTNIAEVGISGIFPDASGAGATAFTSPAATPLATGLLTATGTAGWCSTITTPTVTVMPGETFWLGLEAFSRIAPPQMNGGNAGPTACWWRRPNYLANAWVVSGSVYNPILRVRCADVGSPVPILTATGVPQLGQSMTLNVGGGTANLPAFMIFALGDAQWLSMPIPVSLAPFGAPACQVWTSSDSFQLLVLDGMGQATMSLTVPNNAGLAGFRFYNQVAALSPGSNALSLAFSNAGRALLNP